MPKKKGKVESDSDDNDDFKIPKKKGHKFAICESDDDQDGIAPKSSTSKGKISCFHSRFHK